MPHDEAQFVDCEQFQSLMVDYIDGESTVETRRMIHLHLQDCPGCTRLFRSVRRTITYCHMADCRDMPVEARQQLWTALRVEFRTVHRRQA